MSPLQYDTNRLIWIVLLAVAALDGIGLWQAHMALDIAHLSMVLAILFSCIVLSLFYRHIRHDERLYALGQTAAQFMGAAIVIGIFSYLGALLNFPLVDEKLITLDRFFGFDWRVHIGWMNDHPLLGLLLRQVYLSDGPQMLIILLLLLVFNHITHIQRFILAFIAAGLAVVMLAALFPAVGGYVHYHIDLAQFPNVQPVAGDIHENIILTALRAHTMETMAFPMQGIVAFPSFHSALAIILIYASLPIRWLAVIAVPLNLLVLCSTPADGGHYLSDVLAGIVIALVVIALARRVTRLPASPMSEPQR